SRSPGGRHSERQLPSPGDVSAQQGDTEALGQRRHPAAEGAHLRQAQARCGQGAHKPLRLGPHRRQVREVDGEGLVAHVLQGAVRAPKVDALHHRVGGDAQQAAAHLPLGTVVPWADRRGGRCKGGEEGANGSKFAEGTAPQKRSCAAPPPSETGGEMTEPGAGGLAGSTTSKREPRPTSLVTFTTPLWPST